MNKFNRILINLLRANSNDSIDFDDEEMTQVDKNNPNHPTNPLGFFFLLRTSDGNDVASSAISQLFQLAADSILCRFRRMQHIVEHSLCCALCTCSPNYCKLKISPRKEKNQSSWRSENVAAHASFPCNSWAQWGERFKRLTNYASINVRSDAKKNMQND